jgi:outer membrane protein OmpA-like peptidoglycan-associated protein
MNVMFGFNSAQVIDTKNEMIRKLSDILKANSNIHLSLVGHTCNIGTHKVNKVLGMKRANNVKQKFIDQGVSNTQLKTESKAYDQPLVPNTSTSNRAKNRRVEMIVISKEESLNIAKNN